MRLLASSLAATFLLFPSTASATHCDEGCAIAADAIVAVGGVVSSIGMQVELMKGTPSEEWATTGAVFGVGNVIGGGVLLLISIAVEDKDLATTLRILGGTQLAIAAGDGIGVAMTHLARENTIVIPSASEPTPQSVGLSVSF